MSIKNICEVDLLTTMTENTNTIVEENGNLRRVNLAKEIDTITQTINGIKLEITTLKKSITLPSNAYCSPYSYHGSFTVLDTDVEAYGEPINIGLTNAANVAMGASFGNISRRDYTLSSTSADNSIIITFIKLVK